MTASNVQWPVDGQPPRRTPRLSLPRLGRHARALSLLTGAGLVIAGIAVVVMPLIGVLQRGHADDRALSQWRSGGSAALAGRAPDGGPAAGSCSSAAPSQSYALVSFPSLGQFGYSGVAGDGTWDMLLQRSMVHYQGSAAPGQPGNDIIAFHREPGFEHIDELAAGAVITVQDRSCRTWHYRVTQRWVVAPERVTQLAPTSAAVLTLVTCTPWFRDTERIVWRAVLIDPAQSPASGTPSPVGAPAPPVIAPARPAPTPRVTPTPRPTPAPTRAAKPGPTRPPKPAPEATPEPPPSSSPSSAPSSSPSPTPPVPVPTLAPGPDGG